MSPLPSTGRRIPQHWASACRAGTRQVQTSCEAAGAGQVVAASAEQLTPIWYDKDFDSLFTVDKPIIFAFHGYPWLIHRPAYRRKNHANLHVRGYKEKGNINTPLEPAIQNEIDRFSLAIDVINRVPKIKVAGAHAKELREPPCLTRSSF